MCNSSELNEIQLQVSVQICNSLICMPWLVLWARSHLPDAVFCGKVFFGIYSCVSNSACVTHVQVIQSISPQSWLPDPLPTWEGKGTLETRCFPSSLFFPLHQMGLCPLGLHLVFQSAISLALYQSLLEAQFSLRLINIPWISWGGYLSEEYTEIRCRAKSAASRYSQIMPETFCRLKNKVWWSSIMCIPRISQKAVFHHFKKTILSGHCITLWFYANGIRSKFALVSWSNCAHVALCSVHKAQGCFLFCPCKFDYGKIKC